MGDTALVLGGGGLTGVGWEIGILHGLARAGVDPSAADLVVGTSAGSVVGAQLTSGVLSHEELFERQLVDPKGEIPATMGPAMFARYAWGAVRSRDAKAYGIRMGKMASALRTVPAEDRREVIAQRLLSHDWPEDRRLVVTAVDATTGDLVPFDRDSGVGLVDAVSASCAVPGVWPPITIDGRRYIDGGVHSSANAALAAGYAKVLIIAPMAMGGGPLPTPRAQAAKLAAAGAKVVLITPTREARRTFGRNVLDPTRRAPAARAGLAQATAHVAEVRRLWED
ncbi:patatin-like phospholipase family protein [Streptomyces sp. TRM66268-LWL]|uniref:Patatin-like phospholipase family protein n=1 Tax=Streptomyces polyasparticus TaxID=2767826 RepID=A0ABR7STC5_9ACTN|nr:patatin-like phospholipase family protein [Streptomyces polyasparticus]MBC9718747.1 patatin-like phospholipase family protein [Streptomyces polyasparticus]